MDHENILLSNSETEGQIVYDSIYMKLVTQNKEIYRDKGQNRKYQQLGKGYCLVGTVYVGDDKKVFSIESGDEYTTLLVSFNASELYIQMVKIKILYYTYFT